MPLSCGQRKIESPSSRRAWIEISPLLTRHSGRKSPSSRRAWIEINSNLYPVFFWFVALLAEGVDRNTRLWNSHVAALVVALLAEGVDRNISFSILNNSPLVALLAEGVDRNHFGHAQVRGEDVALLAEGVDRNWRLRSSAPTTTVALLAEGVDRNSIRAATNHSSTLSPSSRRAWIEITAALFEAQDVAGRPPRGGRG